MHKKRAEAVFELPSSVCSEALSNLKTTMIQNKGLRRKKVGRINKQERSFLLKYRVYSEVPIAVGDNINNIERILELKIIKVRQEMVTIGLAKGLNNPETLNLSQKLDALLNQYSQLK
ncbi:aspartyl-phosphate phosphatase Spo0E family protein [Bacillus sp. FJAT-49711]|uniref:aspartyl-phosphate phosphatase Spo0E family protein n=1 Tax=Bacillus sp. FJAT-49711 TaxID=2833585 RepID=UPI00201690B7|nr:aspartyl-phosphate phosphatase Spo0E family protein [Bacillus sp. FJAT-49711]